MTTAWPDVVWDAALLRSLDARARSELEAAGRLRRLRTGESLFVHGDPADAVFVVASGACALHGVRRGDEDAVVIRRAGKGDLLGEEATVADFSTRQLDARCEEDAVVAELPLVVLRRALGRAGGDAMTRVERALRRAATLDLLRTTSFTRSLPEGDLAIFLDAARHVHLARGEHVYREGELAEDAFLVADGLLQAQTNDDGKPRIEAYLSRGDVLGDEELADREPRRMSVVASGPTWLVALPRDVFIGVARRNEGRLDGTRRLHVEPQGSASPGVHTTAFALQDLYRLRVARSLLVIDQDSCIRCGHCAWSCADVHDDGVSRLVRRGDKVVVDEARVTAPLLVPNSCQHCKNPSCMIGCPTGAIGRDARGEVFIREDLCTGCGSCAKACPWENIQIAPRAGGGVQGPGIAVARSDRKSGEPRYPLVAVKCDLCKGVDGGPACVASCPTQAIARIDPNAALVPLRPASSGSRAASPLMPTRTAAGPFFLGAALAAAGVATMAVGRWTSGITAGVLVAILVAYALGKRVRVVLAPWRGKVPIARWMYISHASIGLLLAGVVAAHVRANAIPPNAAGALTLALGAAMLTGIVGAAISAFVPRALSRVERKSVLPEELAARPKELDEKIFAALSGKSELVKTLFVRALRPYRRSPFGPLLLLLARRSLRAEEKTVRARLDALTGGKKGDALAGLDELVGLVVEHRAVRAQRLLTWVLRGWLVPHLAATAASVILIALHVLSVTRGAR